MSLVQIAWLKLVITAALLIFILITICEANRVSTTQKKSLNFGVILPHSSFREREYKLKLKNALEEIRRREFNFSLKYSVMYEMYMMQMKPSPIDILKLLCENFLTKNVSAILYLSNFELFGATTTSAQYFLQLAGYLGIPVICWNADNSGMEQMSKNINLQLAPSVHHQCAAMLDILQRYKWHKFGIVTSQIAGHNDFLLAVRDLMLESEPRFRFILLDIVMIDSSNVDEIKNQLSELAKTEIRIILLHATREEATIIFDVARDVGLIDKNYVWIVTHSVIGNEPGYVFSFPSGLLGVHFDAGSVSLLKEMEKAIKVFSYGLESFVADQPSTNETLQPNLSCWHGESKWAKGEQFYRYLRNISISVNSQTTLEFNYDGTLKYAELDIMNLNNELRWDKIGKWTREGLDIKDIVWPGNAHVPPPGVPEKFQLKVVFLEEPAFINLTPPDPVSGNCINRGVHCKVGKESDYYGLNATEALGNATLYQCCSGLSVDLLEKYAEDLRFTYEMFRVEDGYWGAEVGGKWNGLVAALLQNKADMVMSAFKINSYREEVVDFSEAFMETGIAIVVAKRTGIVSPKAFLEPFDNISWLFILVIGIQVAALSIFLFEWLSPSGYGMKLQPPRDHRFSLFRTYWLVWAILFGAAVNVDCPRGYTARYMASVWAMFAVVFLAIYTANLAAFMITREEYYKLSGVEDPKLANPSSVEPPFRYGTVPYSNTHVVIQRNLARIHEYMKPYNQENVTVGMNAVKTGALDAFIYDATVLQHLVGQDDDCRLLTVGSWYARTGYGLAFTKNSKYLSMFNRLMMTYKENGDLERLQRYWLSGGCRPGKKNRTSSKPLSLDQFTSAFLLLSCGIFLAVFLMIVEHIYFKYVRKHLAKTDSGGCCALISLSMAKSLTFKGAVTVAQDLMRIHKCKDPLCDMYLWKIKQELDMARLRVSILEGELQKKESQNKSPETSKRFSCKVVPYKNIVDTKFQQHEIAKNGMEDKEPMEISTCYKQHHYKSDPTEIAEIETVL